MFVAYCEESKAYKLYNPSTKKLTVSRDVQFIEDEAWDGTLDKTVNVKTIVSHEEEQEGTATNNPSLVVPPPPQQIQQTTLQAGIRTALRSQVVLLQAHHRDLKYPQVRMELQAHQEDQDSEI